MAHPIVAALVAVVLSSEEPARPNQAPSQVTVATARSPPDPCSTEPRAPRYSPTVHASPDATRGLPCATTPPSTAHTPQSMCAAPVGQSAAGGQRPRHRKRTRPPKKAAAAAAVAMAATARWHSGLPAADSDPSSAMSDLVSVVAKETVVALAQGKELKLLNMVLSRINAKNRTYIQLLFQILNTCLGIVDTLLIPIARLEPALILLVRLLPNSRSTALAINSAIHLLARRAACEEHQMASARLMRVSWISWTVSGNAQLWGLFPPSTLWLPHLEPVWLDLIRLTLHRLPLIAVDHWVLTAIHINDSCRLLARRTDMHSNGMITQNILDVAAALPRNHDAVATVDLLLDSVGILIKKRLIFDPVRTFAIVQLYRQLPQPPSIQLAHLFHAGILQHAMETLDTADTIRHESTRLVQLIASDGARVNFPAHWTQRAPNDSLIRAIADDSSHDTEPVTVSHARGAQLVAVADFLDPRRDPFAPHTEAAYSDWTPDATGRDLHDLWRAANYLGLPAMCELCEARLAVLLADANTATRLDAEFGSVWTTPTATQHKAINRICDALALDHEPVPQFSLMTMGQLPVEPEENEDPLTPPPPA